MIGEEAHRITKNRLGDEPLFVHKLLLVKKVAALANQQAGHLSADESARIQKACAELSQAQEAPRFTVDLYSGGGSILINTQMNALIAERSGIDTKKINLSQSTADTVSTALHLFLYELSSGFLQSLQESVRLLHGLEKKLQTVASVSRTCLQDALPSHLGVLFSGAATQLERRGQNLSSLFLRLLKVNLGGTVIGDSSGASVAYQSAVIVHLQNETRWPVTLKSNLLDAAQNADELAELNQELALLASGLIKICKDQRLLASGPIHGFNEIKLPQVMPGSSFFGAHKNNPTLQETVLQACFLILGRTRTAMAALEHAEMHLNVFESTIALAAADSMQILERALRHWNTHGLSGIEAASNKSEITKNGNPL